MTAEYDGNDVPEPKSPGALIDYFDIRTPLLMLCIAMLYHRDVAGTSIIWSSHHFGQFSAPILLGLALYRWHFRVFDFDPMRRAPGAIW